MEKKIIVDRKSKRTKKQLETEKWVDEYIEKNGFPPTYAMIEDEFKIDASAAYYRCRNFRHKLRGIKRSDNPIYYFIIKKFSHLSNNYKTFEEYKNHILSSEMKVPMPQVLELIKEYQFVQNH